MKLNVYVDQSVERPSLVKESIRNGVDLIGQYVGGISVRKTFKLKLPKDRSGLVDVYRVGYGNFDYLTEIHLIAAPLASPHDTAVGLSGYDSGIVYLNSGSNNAHTNMTTVAHEIAHSIGYVLSDSPQAIKRHCSDTACIMFDTVGTVSQENFCTCCRADMKDTHPEHIERLRASRFKYGSLGVFKSPSG